MENTQGVPNGTNTGVDLTKAPIPSPTAKENNPANTVDETSVNRVAIQCSIRRRGNLTALPGLDPNEKVYKLSAALSAQSGKNLKGVDSNLERILLPKVNFTADNDILFNEKANEYWGNIGVIIPADEPYLKESEKGKVLKFILHIKGTRLKEIVEKENDIERKFNTICEGLLKGTIEFTEDDGIADFLLLGFALKNRDVAKDQSLVALSPRIKYYIYNKTSAVKSQLSRIELKNKATAYFSKVQDDETLLDALLVMFNRLPMEFETTFDKVIALDEAYSKDDVSMQKFLDFESDKDLKIKYVIRLALKNNKLTQPANTDSYYYNEVLIGRNMAETIAYLRSGEPEAENIKNTLKHSLKLK